MILLTILVIMAIIACPSKPRYKPKTAVYTSRADPEIRRLQAENKLRQQERRERERLYKQQEKERAQAEKTRQQKEQAEADTLFYQNQLDTIINLLADVEDKINGVNWNIEIDKRTRALDAMQKHIKQKEQLVKKQMQYENRVHTLESKIAKCYYIINS